MQPKGTAIRFSTTRPLAAAMLLALAASGCFLSPDDDDPAGNRGPVLGPLTADTDTVATESSLALWIEATDPDGDELAYAWSATDGTFTSGADSTHAVWQAPHFAGDFTLTVGVSDGRTERSDSLVVTVLQANPVLAPLPNVIRLHLARTEGTLDLVNTGFGPMSWGASSTEDWLSVSPASGTMTDSATLKLRVDRSGLDAGTHHARIQVVSDGGDATATVLIRVTDEPAWTYRVVNRYPHDPGAFTQGLLIHDGELYESTGLYGESTLRRVDLTTGEVRRSIALDASDFGEGLALWDTTLVQITWQSNVAYRWGLESFTPLGAFSYSTAGWGLTTDADGFVMSDGTSTIFFRDPITFTQTGTIPVTDSLGTVHRLNELEWVDGEIWANVWPTEYVARIDPATGDVTGWIDLSGLLTPVEAGPANVLNGIARDPDTGRLYFTGKDWPWLFELEIIPAE